MPLFSSSCPRLTPFAVRAGTALVAFLLATGWSGLWLAGRGQFAAATTGWIGLAGAALGWWLAGPLARATAPFSPRTCMTGLGLFLLALLPNLRQSEMVLGGWDPGVYLHTAAAVARGGAVQIVDPDLAALTDDERLVLSRNLFGVSEPFGGMRILPNGTTSPSFHHAYPCLMASAWPLGGVRAAWWVNPLFHTGSVLLIAVLASLLWGVRWGWVAGVLLAVSPAQVWQAGFPTAEMTTQFFLLAGAVFLLLSQSRREGGSGLALLSAWCLGFALLLRYDTILLLVPVMLWLLAGLPGAAYPGRILVMLAALVAPVAHFHHIQTHVAPYYHPVSSMVVPVLTAVTGVILAWLLVRTLARRWLAPRLDRWDAHLRRVLAFGFVIWLVIAGVVRPWLAAGGGGVGWLRERFGAEHTLVALLAGHDAGNIFHLAAFVGWPALVLALAALVTAVWTCRDLSRRALLYAATVSLVIITTHVFNDHFLMWVARRFVPVILPLLVVLAVGAMAGLARRGWWPRATVAGAALVAVLAAFPASDAAYLARHRDWPGLLAWVERVEQGIPPGATVFCDQPGFAAPLRYLHGHRSYELQRREPDARTKLAEVMRGRLERGEEVVFLTMRGPIPDAGLAFTSLADMPLESSIVQDTLRGIPASLKSRGGNFVLYRVEPVR